MSEIVLRPRQEVSIESLRSGIKTGHRAQVLMAGTGAGKTVCGAFLIQECVRKFRRSLFICDRTQLVNQTSATFDRYRIDHGVIQANHWRWRPYEKAQVCSVQTLGRRDFPEDVNLVIIDECHSRFELTTRLIQERKDIIFIGLSATPFSKGLGLLYTNVVNAMTTNDLLAEGWLTPLVVYVGKKADLTGVHTNSRGEWNEEEVAERNLTITGDIVSEWVEKTSLHFGGPAKTIAFSASVNDGAVLCNRFREAGYRFEQISYKTPDAQREEIMEEFSRPDTAIVGLVSVEALAKGFDQSDVKVGIDARPLRKSLSGHMQMIGRVMRAHYSDGDMDTIEGRKESMSAGGKPFALWLCHSNNYLRFMDERDDIFEHGLSSLDERGLDDHVYKDPEEKVAYDILCKKCKAVLKPTADQCPCCGTRRERRSLVEHVAGEMVRVEDVEKPLLNASTGRPLPDWMKDRGDIWAQLCSHAFHVKNGDIEKARKLALGTYRGFYGEWPKGEFSECLVSVDPRLESKCHQARLQYFKRARKTA